MTLKEQWAQTPTIYELIGALLIYLFIVVYPRIDVLWISDLDQLVTHRSEGVVAFEKRGRNGYVTLVGGNRYTCALTGLDSHDCAYWNSAGVRADSKSLRKEMTGKTATVTWAESQSLKWNGYRVIVELAIGDHIYRRTADYDRWVATARDSKVWIFLTLCFVFYFYKRLKMYFNRRG